MPCGAGREAASLPGVWTTRASACQGVLETEAVIVLDSVLLACVCSLAHKPRVTGLLHAVAQNEQQQGCFQ